MSWSRPGFISLMLLIILAAPLQAGVVLVSRQQVVSGQTTRTDVRSAYFEADRMRLELGDRADDLVLVFLPKQRKLLFIDGREKTYLEFTAGDREVLDGETKPAVIEEPALAPAILGLEPEFKMANPKVKVGTWTAKHWVKGQGAEKMREIWMADWSEIGLTPEDFAVLDAYDDFLCLIGQNKPESVLPISFFSAVKYSPVQGVPVKLIHYLPFGTETIQLLEVRREALPPSLFTIPEGVTKKALATDQE